MLPHNCHPRAMFGDTVMVSGWWFHCGQALIKCPKKIGLTNAHRNEEKTQEVFWCLLADIQRRDSHGYRGFTVEDPAGAIVSLRP